MPVAFNSSHFPDGRKSYELFQAMKIARFVDRNKVRSNWTWEQHGLYTSLCKKAIVYMLYTSTGIV